MNFKENILKLSSEIVDNIIEQSERLYKNSFYKNKIKKLNIIDKVKSYTPEERLIELPYILSATNSRARSLFYIFNNINIIFLYNPSWEASGQSNYTNNTITVNMSQIASMYELQSTIIHELSHLKDKNYSLYNFDTYKASAGIEYFTHDVEVLPWLMEIWFNQYSYKTSFDEALHNAMDLYCEAYEIDIIKSHYISKINNDEFLKNNFKCLLEIQN